MSLDCKDAMYTQVEELVSRFAADAGLVGLTPAGSTFASAAPAGSTPAAREALATSSNYIELLRHKALIGAPMAGVSDRSYRIMSYLGGAAACVSEMVSVAGLFYKSSGSWDLVEPSPYEPPLIVQLFGSVPEQFVYATQHISQRLGQRLRAVDINMACPVSKVVKKGEGASLMNTPEAAAEIVRAVVSAAPCPVTVKIRRGYDLAHDTSLAFAETLVDAGAEAIEMHGRFAKQLYKGDSNLDAIRQLARVIDVPVVASGDMFSADHVAKSLCGSELASVMIARGTYGNPWIFRDAREKIQAWEKLHVNPQAQVEGEMNPQVKLQVNSQAQVEGEMNPQPNPQLNPQLNPLIAGQAAVLTQTLMPTPAFAPTPSNRVKRALIDPVHSYHERLTALELHLRLLDCLGAHMYRGRSLASWYVQGLPAAREARQAFMEAKDLDDFLRALDSYAKTLDAVC